MRNLYLIVVAVVFVAVVCMIGAAAYDFYSNSIPTLTETLQKMTRPIGS